jgi:glutathione S-transferase
MNRGGDASVQSLGWACAGAVAGAGIVMGWMRACQKELQSPKELKILYFPIAGRAGPVRACCQIGRIKYENIYLDEASLKELKPSLPFGQVPVFDFNHTTRATQSVAFLRFVGKFSGLYPQEDPYLALRIDEMVDACGDFVNILLPSIMEKDRDKRMKMRAKLMHEEGGSVRRWLKGAENLLALHGGPYAIGPKMTIADLSLQNLFNWISSGIEGVPTDLISDENCPMLSRLKSKLGQMKCWDLEYK